MRSWLKGLRAKCTGMNVVGWAAAIVFTLVVYGVILAATDVYVGEYEARTDLVGSCVEVGGYGVCQYIVANWVQIWKEGELVESRVWFVMSDWQQFHEIAYLQRGDWLYVKWAEGMR